MCDVDADHYLFCFEYLRTLRDDPIKKSAVVLGRAPKRRKEDGAIHSKADNDFDDVIMIIEKEPLDQSFLSSLEGHPEDLHTDNDDEIAEVPLEVFEELGQNDVYHWSGIALGGGHGNAKATVIRPATAVHIKKYSQAVIVMVTESPEIYRQHVQPWIESQPRERIEWVYNILDKKKEADTILYEKEDAKDGYIIVPDMKWDRKTRSALYLVAIVHDRSIRSMRDLKPEHVPMLESILEHGTRVAKERYDVKTQAGQANGSLRCFIHYHPTYYHFHVHLLNAEYTSHPGAVTGQAHLLQDVIDLLKLGVDFTKRTLTYSMAVNHPLLEHLSSSGAFNSAANGVEPADKKQRLA